MAWTKEFDEILKGVLKRSDPTLLDGEEIAAVTEIVEKGFEAVKNDKDVNSLLSSIDTSGLTDDEFEVVHYAQSLADEDYHNRVERHADIISSPDYLGLRDEGFKYAHPNYGGSENPDYEFFDVFRTAGQKEGVYSIDVPLTQEVREAVEHEPENSLPGDPNQNYCRLEITIDKDGHPDVVLDGSEGDGLDEHLFDVYNMSIRAGVERYALEHGLIADRGVDADNENDPVPYQDDRKPMTADWGVIPERAVSDDGRLLREVDGKTIAAVNVPDHLAKRYDLDLVSDLGVQFDDAGRVELHIKTNGGEVSLDRQFTEKPYLNRFEGDLFAHYRDDIQQDSERLAAEKAAAKVRMAESISVTADSDFPETDALDRYLKVSIDGQVVNIIGAFNEEGRVADVEINPDQDGFDPATDGGARYKELSDLLESVKSDVVRQVQDYHDNVDARILQDTGWLNSRTLKAGYCVITEAEIDRAALDVETAGMPLTGGDFRTADGYPIRLDFDVNGNLESATIPGTKTSLNPVLEGSRNHFVEAKAQLADSGIVLSKADSGDYRVDYHQSSSSYRAGERGSVRYADSVTAAVGVGQKMAAERDQQVASRFHHEAERERMVA